MVTGATGGRPRIWRKRRRHPTAGMPRSPKEVVALGGGARPGSSSASTGDPSAAEPGDRHREDVVGGTEVDEQALEHGEAVRPARHPGETLGEVGRGAIEVGRPRRGTDRGGGGATSSKRPRLRPARGPRGRSRRRGSCPRSSTAASMATSEVERPVDLAPLEQRQGPGHGPVAVADRTPPRAPQGSSAAEPSQTRRNASRGRRGRGRAGDPDGDEGIRRRRRRRGGATAPPRAGRAPRGPVRRRRAGEPSH